MRFFEGLAAFLKKFKRESKRKEKKMTTEMSDEEKKKITTEGGEREREKNDWRKWQKRKFKGCLFVY